MHLRAAQATIRGGVAARRKPGAGVAEPRPKLVAAVEISPAKGSLAMQPPQIAVLISTFQRPLHLRAR